MRLLLSVVCCGLLFNVALSAIIKPTTKHVIVDVDLGIDDYQALSILLSAERDERIKIVAIICSEGNTKKDYVIRNVLMFLETAGRTDIPVYAGSDHMLLSDPHRDYYFGIDGFGDLNYSNEPNYNRVKKCIAPTALHQLVSAKPKKYSLIILGPNTNTALALRMYDNVKDNLKEIFIMGGNSASTTTRAEFNFLSDVEAASIVLKQTTVPITMLTWEGCISETVQYKWRFDISDISNPVYDLLTRAEQYFRKYPETDDYVSCDAILAATIIEPKIVKRIEAAGVSIDLHAARGVVFHTTNPNSNVQIIEEIDIELFKTTFIDAFKTVCFPLAFCRYIY